MKPQNILFFLLIIVLGASSLLFKENSPLWTKLYSNKESKPKNPSNESPEYQIQGFSSKNYKPSGELSSILTANQLSFFSSSNSSKLKAPTIDVFDQNKSGSETPIWRLRADQANTQKPNNHIFLKDNIEMVQIAHQSEQKEIIVRSQEMEILLEEELAKTTKQVSIVSERDRIQGTGLHANLGESSFKLNSNISSEYAYTPKNPETGDKTFSIEADSFELETEAQKATYQGNVILKQENIVIYAETLILFKDQEAQNAQAFGSPAKFVQTSIQSNQAIYAEAKQFKFNNQEKILRMYGQSKLQQGDTIVEGDYLFYDTKTENIGAESQSETRVKMILPTQGNNPSSP